MLKEIITNSPEESKRLAYSLGSTSKPGSVFALYGALGTGKTIIAKGIALGMGIKDEITSPTFTLLEIYDNPLPLYHFDLYRINHIDELNDLGFDEYWYGHGVSVIEWAEKARERIPAHAITIRLFYIDELKRRIVIEYPYD